ncbi:MAG: radical SAM protein [Patescibacteria group bacterium]|nr:radical SAM protein [Patescibacteria group bacterium]
MENKILLVSFQSNTDTIGLKYIQSYLVRNNINSRILFIPQFNKKDLLSVEKFLKDYEPKIIGISLMSPEFFKAKEFSLYVKKVFPEIIIVWGGIHPTADPKECINYADYVFMGESEQAYLEFVNAISENKPVNDISNLVYKSSKGISINKLRPFNENLDALPFPEHFPQKSLVLHNGNIIELSKHFFKKYTRYSGKFYSLTTTRGCPFSCAYCCNSVFSKLYGITKVRKRSVENVIEEMEHAIQLFPDIIYFNIQDDNFFSYDIHWMKSFADASEKKIKKMIVCRTTPAHLNEEKIFILKRAGLSWIFMGLQSGSPRINKEIYKRFVPNEKFIEAAKVVFKNGIAGYYDVILDNPYETEQDIMETINVILKIPKPFMLQLFSLCFYQGTEIYERALKENLIIENPLKKNYAKYQPTYLNKVIKLCPVLPRCFIKSMVINRKSQWAKILVNSIYLPSILILEPFVWFKLILISFDYNIFSTVNMIYAFFKTGFSEMILKKFLRK